MSVSKIITFTYSAYVIVIFRNKYTPTSPNKIGPGLMSKAQDVGGCFGFLTIFEESGSISLANQFLFLQVVNGPGLLLCPKREAFRLNRARRSTIPATVIELGDMVKSPAKKN